MLFRSESMRPAYDLIQKHGVDYYLNLLPASNQELRMDDHHLLAMEIAVALNNYYLAEQAVGRQSGEDRPMKVVALHLDLRDFNLYLYVAETNRFVALTDHPALPVQSAPLAVSDISPIRRAFMFGAQKSEEASILP